MSLFQPPGASPLAAPLSPPVDVVIMAAGKGTRMKSRLPKVLQRLAHVPLVQHVLITAQQLQARSTPATAASRRQKTQCARSGPRSTGLTIP